MNGKDTTKKVKPKSTTASPKPKHSMKDDTEAKIEAKELVRKLNEDIKQERLLNDDVTANVMRQYFGWGFLLGSTYMILLTILVVMLNMLLKSWGIEEPWRTLIGCSTSLGIGYLAGKGLDIYTKREEHKVRYWEQAYKEVEKKKGKEDK